MALQPPTSRLPPIQNIPLHPVGDLAEALTYLHHIYNPEVRGSRRYRPEARPSNTDASLLLKRHESSGLDDLRSDAFERSYAMRWLTALVAQAEMWNSESTTVAPEALQSTFSRERDQLIHNAASILAVCSGTAAAGIVVRDFTFDRPGGGSPLKVHIRDVPLDNGDYGSVGAQTWGGACVLAETFLDDPTRFGMLTGDQEVRVLELGAGTGLVSLTVGKLLESVSGSNQGATIIATDYYPSVLENLESNIRSNFACPHDSSMVRISSHFLDWSLFANEPTPSPQFDEPFDLILGADIVYEAQHATWIKSCVRRLLKKPSEHEDPLFHLMIPLRSTHSSESSTIDTVFGYPQDDISPSEMTLKIITKENISCEAGSGLGPAQVEYAYYRIGWR